MSSPVISLKSCALLGVAPLAAAASLAIAASASGTTVPPLASHTVAVDVAVPAIKVSEPGASLLTVTIDGQSQSVGIPAASLSTGGTLHVEATEGGGTVSDPVIGPCPKLPDGTAQQGSVVTLSGLAGPSDVSASFTQTGASQPAASADVPVAGGSHQATISVCAS